MADSLPDSCYAYVDGDTKKLPLCDPDTGEVTAHQVGMAAAALSSGGFRGEKVQIPDSAKAAVKAKVAAAWRKVNPDKDAADMPAGIKASEPRPFPRDPLLSFFQGDPELSERYREHVRAGGDPDAFVEASPGLWRRIVGHFAAPDRELADPTGTDLYVPAPIGNLTYHRKLHKLVASHLAKHGVLTADDYVGLAKTARGHAGGKAKAAAGKQASEPEPVLAYDPFDQGGGLDDCVKLAKNDPLVNYRDSAIDPDATGPVDNPDPDHDGDVDFCGSCRFFRYGTCSLVEGAIEADDVCDLHHDALVLYVPDAGMYAETAALRPDHGIGQDGTRFMQPRTFAGASEWVQFLPPPGTYAHTVYGDIELTPARLANMLANFRANTYGQDLPINAEHDSRASGTVGWIRDMRQAADGSLEVKPEWNDRGRALLDGDRFRYVSAEFFESWQEPVSADWHDDVAVGMAICARPHFKTNVLRPLAATEGQALPPGTGREGDIRMSDEKDTQANPAANPAVATAAPPEPKAPAFPVPMALSEDELREFRELKKQAVVREREMAELKEQAEVHAARTAAVEHELRVKKFTDLVMGQGGAGDGCRWFGPPADNVKKLLGLAERLGEDDPLFQQVVADHQAYAKRLKESNLFGPVGSTESDGDNSPRTQVAAMAAEKRAKDPTLTEAKAVAQVYAERPELYTQMIGGR